MTTSLPGSYFYLRKVDLVDKGVTMFSRKLSAIPLAILLLLIGVPAAGGDADTEDAFREKTRQIATAYSKNDIEFLDGVYADSFLITAQSNDVATKKQLLDNQRFDEGTTFDIADFRTVRLGDTVVALYELTWNYSDGGYNQVRFTDVWVKEDSVWLILTSHATMISLE